MLFDHEHDCVSSLIVPIAYLVWSGQLVSVFVNLGAYYSTIALARFVVGVIC